MALQATPRRRSKTRGTVLTVADVVFAPFFGLASRMLYLARKYTFKDLPRSAEAIRWGGVYPLIDHYYEPLIHPRQLSRPLSEPRALPGLDIDVERSLAVLKDMEGTRELTTAIAEGAVSPKFQLDNQTFSAGDAEVLFGLIRSARPRRVIEVGCGNSSLVIEAALRRNAAEDGVEGEHVCVEPYEVPWLEEVRATVHRSRIEDTPLEIFEALGENDVLFIDSSHMIRPQGDVLFIVLQLLGRLRPGVYVHFHDIFSPRDYPEALIIDRMLFWNEQYILEAYLVDNPEFEIVLPINHLWHERRADLHHACPGLVGSANVPASFWIRRRSHPS